MESVSDQVREKVHRFLAKGNLAELDSSEKGQLLNALDLLCRRDGGLKFLYDHVDELVAKGFFYKTVWDKKSELNPPLVKGTLCSGYPNNVYETISELHMVKIAREDCSAPNFSPSDAKAYLEDTFVHCFDLAFSDETEELRNKLSASERKRFKALFKFILQAIPAERIKNKIRSEISAISHQRPILTGHLTDLIRLAAQQFEWDKEQDPKLFAFVAAYNYPGILSYENANQYGKLLADTPVDTLYEEAVAFGKSLKKTGLSSAAHAIFVLYVNEYHPDLLPECLGLSEYGGVEIKYHKPWIQKLIQTIVSEHNFQVLYPLSELLNKNLLSRKPVLNGLKKLKTLPLHPDIVELLANNKHLKSDLKPSALLLAGAIYILGQPLGIRQGMNPTCQSARGISMWSQHAPAKLLNMIIQAAIGNQLEFRYQGALIRTDGSVFKSGLHLELDPVSMILVPHLDHIYNKMMQLASGLPVAEDPHVSVNPAFYGHWIQTGFLSCYSAALHAIVKYRSFITHFYAAFHPAYNGGFKLIYPVPLGIIVTNSKAEFLGFHAVSLLRVKDTGKGMRAFFYNPNNEGRQNWGQGISPTVSGFGEKHGESSLPITEFASRVYAFHFGPIETEHYLEEVPKEICETTETLARNSWGNNYVWL